MKVLSLKHWQVFILIFGLHFAFKFFLLLKPDSHWVFINYQPLISLMTGLIFTVWLWLTGTDLKIKLMEGHSTNKLFNGSILTMITYLLMLFLYMKLKGFPDSLYLMPFHILFLMSAFYCLAFVAKKVKTFEEGRIVNFSQYAGDFLLLFLFPIGIWFIQPRINKISSVS